VPSLRRGLPAFWPDSRGNRLKSWETVNVRDSDHIRLYLCGPEEVADQVMAMLQPLRPRLIELRDDQRRTWSHRIHLEGPLVHDYRAAVEILTTALTIVRRPPIDIALALDFYKDPVRGEDGATIWRDTPAGSMVHQAKYWGNDKAAADLASGLVTVIGQHRLYSAADFIVAVPGHDRSKVSFGERLAADVAQRVDMPLVKPTVASAVRPQRKAQDEQEEPMHLEGEFRFGAEVVGRVLLVVDDVYRSGDTMAAIASAAKTAGAAAVFGLVGAKTLRK
jgi:hypothetical protein